MTINYFKNLFKLKAEPVIQKPVRIPINHKCVFTHSVSGYRYNYEYIVKETAGYIKVSIDINNILEFKTRLEQLTLNIIGNSVSTFSAAFTDVFGLDLENDFRSWCESVGVSKLEKNILVNVYLVSNTGSNGNLNHNVFSMNVFTKESNEYFYPYDSPRTILMYNIPRFLYDMSLLKKRFVFSITKEVLAVVNDISSSEIVTCLDKLFGDSWHWFEPESLLTNLIQLNETYGVTLPYPN